MGRIVRTNNAATRQEFIYLGPANMPFGFGVRIPVLVTGILLIPAALVVAWVFTTPLSWVPSLSTAGQIVVRAMLSLGIGVGGTVWLLRKAGKHISPETPIRYWLDVLRAETNAPRPDRGDVVEHTFDPSKLAFFADRNRQVRSFTPPRFAPDPTVGEHEAFPGSDPDTNH